MAVEQPCCGAVQPVLAVFAVAEAVRLVQRAVPGMPQRAVCQLDQQIDGHLADVVQQRGVSNGGGPGFRLRRLVLGAGADGQQMGLPQLERIGATLAALLLLLLPVRQSVLAPAQVVPLGGQVVAAPLDGVITEFLVKPNQPVSKGDILLRFDATSIRAQADVAERSLNVAEAELKANSQRAFTDADSSARIDLYAARVEQKRAERDYARELLARSDVRAERDGIAVFADAQRWTGKPVQTGERLMEIAAPDQAELRIELAVADALDFQPGTEIALFLDSAPLHSHSARLQRSAYEAQQTTSGQLAYRLDATFDQSPPRIGLRGTAKIYGERGPLAFYLLRRPLAALRQTVGL